MKKLNDYVNSHWLRHVMKKLNEYASSHRIGMDDYKAQ